MNLKKAREYYGKIIHFEPYFDDYLKGGLFPFTLTSGIDKDLFLNMLNKVIRKDLIGTSEIKIEEIENIKRILRFIGLSQSEGVILQSLLIQA